MRVFLVMLGYAAACRTSGSSSVSAKHPPVELPVVVEDDRFVLQTKIADGAALRMVLDSAGGMFLTKRAADRLKLQVAHFTTPDGDVDTVAFPQFYDARIPRPPGKLFPVLADDPLPMFDGMFGAPWFAGRVFTFDYAGKRLLLRSAGDMPQASDAHHVALGLRRDEEGEVASPYGRIEVRIDGAALDMVFDTGATVTLTDAARQQLHTAASERAASFVVESVFARWHSAHPDWRVIAAADQAFENAPMIEVPKLAIAGFEVGPVWFTRRPDKTFREGMARMMDKPTDGAIGGSALRHFQRVTVDWAAAIAVFEK